MNPKTSGKYNNNFTPNKFQEDFEDEPVPLAYNINLNPRKSERNIEDRTQNKKTSSQSTITKEKSFEQVDSIQDKNPTFESNRNFTASNNTIGIQVDRISPEKVKIIPKTLTASSNLFAFERRLAESDKVLNKCGKEIEIKLMPNSISDKNVFTRITSDVYFKPIKGDKTPKCALSSEKRDPLEEGSASRQDLLTEREQLHNDNSIARQINYKTDDSEANLDIEGEELQMDIPADNLIAFQNSKKTLDCLSNDYGNYREHRVACEDANKNTFVMNADVISAQDNPNQKQSSKISSKENNNKEEIRNLNQKTNLDKNLISIQNQTAVNPETNFIPKLDFAKTSANNTNLSLNIGDGTREKILKKEKLLSVSHDMSKNNISHNNLSKIKTNLQNTSHQTSYYQLMANHFNQYDIQQLTYDLVKEYSHLKIDNDEDFMKRMLFDVFKRQTREERLDKIIEQNKVKINEVDRVKTFNRLIEDANRRLEAQENLEAMKNKIFDQDSFSNTVNKKISIAEWEEIYAERFLKFKEQHEKWRQEQVLHKVLQEKKKEDEIVNAVITKKAPQHLIDENSKRMFDVAERRKLKLEELIRKKEGNYNEDKNSNEERELTPTKFKKKRKVQNYNFVVNIQILICSPMSLETKNQNQNLKTKMN